MPTFTTRNRKLWIALGVLAGVALAGFAVLAIYGQILGSRNPYGGHNSYGMRDYLPSAQDKAAAAIVAGLRAIAENITAAMPPAGC